MFVLELVAQLNANVDKYLITWLEDAFLQATSVQQMVNITTQPQENAKFGAQMAWFTTHKQKPAKCQTTVPSMNHSTHWTTDA